MSLSEAKKFVAQNCPGYRNRNYYSLTNMSMGTSYESCDNCTNFVRGHCSKDLYDDIRDRITLN